MEQYRGTTICSVRKGNQVVMGGDGQVTLGNTVMKSNARKVRRMYQDQVIAGFAGATADAFTLFERFEGKLERLENKTLRYPGHCAQFKAFSQLGLLEQEPVKVGDIEVVPRDLFHTLLDSKIMQPKVKDV